jgi:hypothetical protein
MEHYRETKDLEEVVKALDNGLKIEALRCGWWTPVLNFHGTLYFDNGETFVPTVIGRIFRIEVKPEAPKRRLERVELFRLPSGDLCYRAAYGVNHFHVCAVSEKGFEHYVYADGVKSLRPVREDGDRNVFPIAFERWVEEEEE